MDSVFSRGTREIPCLSNSSNYKTNGSVETQFVAARVQAEAQSCTIEAQAGAQGTTGRMGGIGDRQRHKKGGQPPKRLYASARHQRKAQGQGKPPGRPQRPPETVSSGPSAGLWALGNVATRQRDVLLSLRRGDSAWKGGAYKAARTPDSIAAAYRRRDGETIH